MFDEIESIKLWGVIALSKKGNLNSASKLIWHSFKLVSVISHLPLK